MRKSEFDYVLPSALIAQTPLARGASRLLCLEAGSGVPVDARFTDLPAYLRRGDLLVLNDTRVLPARLFGRKDSGGRIEALIERALDERRALVQLRASKTPRPGAMLHFDGAVSARVEGRVDEFFLLNFDIAEPLADVLDRIGHIPLPPYIERVDTAADRERYQTVFARERGAVAAPTAGLHFSEAMLTRLTEAGVETASITLHVGAGTFQPLRGEEIEGQRLHAERLRIGASSCEQVNRARRDGRRVIAVGTTVVRALESAARDGVLHPFDGETDIFIYPGFRFQLVDALVTNFHLPQSSLLMLVCAFAGRERVLAAYRHAVARQYRFFSYGDAMYIEKS